MQLDMASCTKRLLQSCYFQCVGCLSKRQFSAVVYNGRPRTYCRLRFANSARMATKATLHTQPETSTNRTFESEHENILGEEEDHAADFQDEQIAREPYDLMYPGHIPTSLFQKALLSVGASAVAITSPWRGDMIAALGETTGYYALVRIRQKMMADPTGRQILQEQPRINTKTVDIDYLRQLPSGTFGRVYADWLEENRCCPDDRLPVHFVDDPELAYVMQRYREIHDLIHALMGMPTHMLGEVVIKWVEGLQLGLPMCVSGGIFGAIRLLPKQRQLYRSTHLQWAIRNGLNAHFLMNVYYEQEWETPVDELREELNIQPPPPTPPKLWKTEKP